MSMSHDNDHPTGLRLVIWVNHHVAKGLTVRSLVTGSALTVPCVRFLEDVPVGSYKVHNLVHEGEESVFVI